MTSIFEHLTTLRQRRKRARPLFIVFWFLGPVLFVLGSGYCHGGDAISAHRQGNHYTENVKGKIVTFSRDAFQKAACLEAMGGLGFLTMIGWGIRDELLKRRILSIERWLTYNRVAVPPE